MSILFFDIQVEAKMQSVSHIVLNLEDIFNVLKFMKNSCIIKLHQQIIVWLKTESKFQPQKGGKLMQYVYKQKTSRLTSRILIS